MAKITGKVVKQKKSATEVLKGIPVIMDDKMIFADNTGKFNFWNVPAGYHVIRINEDMYAPFATRVQVKSDKDIINLGTIYLRWNGL